MTKTLKGQQKLVKPAARPTKTKMATKCQLATAKQNLQAEMILNKPTQTQNLSRAADKKLVGKNMTDIKDHYRLIIIGGGAAGFAAAIKADQLGIDTLMINSGLPLGGTCVNVGCVPSKHLLHLGEIIYQSQHHNYSSLEIPTVNFDFSKAIEEELSLVEAMRKEKYTDVLANLSHIDLLEAAAKFIDTSTVEADGKKISADKFLVTTGSKATVLPLEGIDQVDHITHVEALNIRQLPKRLLVVGGGPVALEMAQLFHHFGSQVTMLVRSNIAKQTEPEIAEALKQYLVAEGITIHIGATINKLEKKGEEKIATITTQTNHHELAFDELLLATGKTPNTKSLNLDSVGVELTNSSAIKVTNSFQTNIENIYAAGDVVSLPLRLETTAGREGTLAVGNMFEGKKDTLNYHQVPYAIFTHPAVAGVGILDKEVPSLGISCACRTIDFTNVPKAKAIKDTRGKIKLIVDDQSKIIKGVHMVAPNAADLIHEAVMIVKNNMTLDDVTNTLHVFPTLSEAIKIAAQSYTQDITKLSCCV